jgi:hypothetical protein
LVAAWLAAGVALVLFRGLDPLPLAVPAALMGLAAIDDAWCRPSSHKTSDAEGLPHKQIVSGLPEIERR